MTLISQTDASVTVRRHFEASPERVYSAWLDPGLVGRWMSPGEVEVAAAEIEPWVGGGYRIWQARDGAPVGGFDGEVLELVPARRIVLRLAFLGPERQAGPAFDSLLTVELAAGEGGGTDLTLVHERLEELRAALPDIADSVGVGWEMTFDKLGAIVR